MSFYGKKERLWVADGLGSDAGSLAQRSVNASKQMRSPALNSQVINSWNLCYDNSMEKNKIRKLNELQEICLKQSQAGLCCRPNFQLRFTMLRTYALDLRKWSPRQGSPAWLDPRSTTTLGSSEGNFPFFSCRPQLEEGTVPGKTPSQIPSRMGSALLDAVVQNVSRCFVCQSVEVWGHSSLPNMR